MEEEIRDIIKEEWCLLGNRKESVLDKNLELLAWSKSLRKEIGFGYSEITTVNSGEYFVKERERIKIVEIIEKNNTSFLYFDKLEEIICEIKKLLEGDFGLKILLDKLILFLTYFYIARIDAKIIYSKENMSIKEKKKIENFRNNKNNFSVFDDAFLRISKELKLPLDLLVNYTYNEVLGTSSGKYVDKSKIAYRGTGVWSLVLKNKNIILFLQDLSPFKADIEFDVNYVKGETVCYSNEVIRGEVGKDILVVVMTTPEMFPEIINKKAIITDEGGILSHASIFCREFNIPCIVGTENATKIFKAGDIVEFDTSKGVVRKIKI